MRVRIFTEHKFVHPVKKSQNFKRIFLGRPSSSLRMN
jgi:hypothetical protein